MNASDKELMEIKKYPKNETNSKNSIETYPDDSYVRVSNYIKIIGKEDYKSPK